MGMDLQSLVTFREYACGHLGGWFMRIGNLLKDDRGTTAIEYAVIAMMVSVACIGGIRALGGQSGTGWTGMYEKTKSVLGY